MSFLLNLESSPSRLNSLAESLTQLHQERLNGGEPAMRNDALVLECFLIADGHSRKLFTDAHGKALVQFLRSALAERDAVIADLLMTDVEGVKKATGERLSSLDAGEAEDLISAGVITGGMIPKVRCALDAVGAGVENVHIIDGRRQHALLLEIFTDSGVGTEIRRGKPG